MGRETFLTALGEKLRELRVRKRLGLRQAARLLGISHTRLAAFEAGQTKATGMRAVPKRGLLEKMAELYDYPAGTLLAAGGYAPTDRSGPPMPGEVETQAQELAHILYRLSDQERRILLGTARLLLAEHVEGPGYGETTGLGRPEETAEAPFEEKGEKGGEDGPT